ncbi:TetR/AcrR family transcriptional regulator [Secundilactobacillus silagei]|uniref:TetR family transcriptional regulator n=1 Tax=Secundilactobacillus silagei JCM 19001 TaxID=1302250 RepID=A0A1Z5IIG8_9LACO|nr:TetR/AcrR family transcriptional regulator [Secundilactobacillus silagei]TDG72902.1 hypothetical protein C5L25_002191 [Secundilactobacillus silagei JCM 19001]GAX01574.1 TetR family transcriptional regulator [Secundilactobacillus silagei JCM 19001]
MRKIDEQKKLNITQAVIDLVEQDGLTNLTTAKVARVAGVSPATLYIYYQDKTDMLSRIYEIVKDELHDGLVSALEMVIDDLDQQIRAVIKFSVQQYRKYPREARFVQTLWNNPELLDDHAREYGTELDTVLGQLFQTILNSANYAALSESAFELLLATPTQLLLRKPEVQDKEIETLIEVIIRAIHA